jgi:hypothetical protein
MSRLEKMNRKGRGEKSKKGRRGKALAAGMFAETRMGHQIAPCFYFSLRSFRFSSALSAVSFLELRPCLA